MIEPKVQAGSFSSVEVVSDTASLPLSALSPPQHYSLYSTSPPPLAPLPPARLLTLSSCVAVPNFGLTDANLKFFQESSRQGPITTVLLTAEGEAPHPTSQLKVFSLGRARPGRDRGKGGERQGRRGKGGERQGQKGKPKCKPAGNGR